MEGNEIQTAPNKLLNSFPNTWTDIISNKYIFYIFFD